MGRYDFQSVGGQAANAIQAFIVQRALAQRQQQQDAQVKQKQADDLKLQQATSARAEQELALQQQEAKDRQQQMRTQSAGIAVGQATPGQDLTPGIVAQIQGTPYEGRLQTQQSLPSSTNPLVTGMPAQTTDAQPFTTLRPSQAQEIEQGDRTRRNALSEKMQANGLNDPSVRAGMADEAIRKGESVPGALLTDPGQALQDDLTKIKASGDQRVREINATPHPSPGDVLQRVDNPDGTYSFVPKSTLAGQSFKKPAGATVANRLASAQAVTQTGQDITTELSDPAFAAQVGPALGRYRTLQDFIGNPPPEFAQLAGQIESYALANMGVHGMRSTQGAEMIKGMLTAKHTPESLIAAIKGLNGFSQHFMENEGVKPGTTSTAAPAGGGSTFRVVGSR